MVQVRPDLAARLEERMMTTVEELPDPVGGSKDFDEDPDVMKRLKYMGYR